MGCPSLFSSLITITFTSILELSSKLDVTPNTLRAYIKQGRLKGQRLGSRWYVSEHSLKMFFEGVPEIKIETKQTG